MVRQSLQYPGRLFEVLRSEGPVAASKMSFDFVRHETLPGSWNFRLQTRYNDLVNRIRYDCPPEPYETRQVCAREINYRTTSLPHIDFRGIGWTHGGEWDRAVHLWPVEKEWVVEGLTQRFVEGRPWEETTYVKRARREFANNDRSSIRGASNPREFLEERCAYVDQLYEDIKTNGYRPASDARTTTETYRGNYRDRLEVLVAIGRCGEIFMHRGGYHRFAIARLLDLDIPVHVACRHDLWQRLRDRVSKSGLSEYESDLRNHPDLQDVLD